MKFISFAFALAFLMAPVLQAQKLSVSCVGALSADCKTNVGAPDGLQQAKIEVLVSRNKIPVPGAIVTFAATSGILLPDTAKTDASGVARSVWIRSKGSDVAAVAVQATLAGPRLVENSDLAVVTLVPTDPTPRAVLLLAEKGFSQSWYQKGQTPKTIKVLIRPTSKDSLLDAASCAKIRVAFKLRGAPQTVSPDTATGFMDRRHNCHAETYWSMGEGIGERRIDVKLVPDQGFSAQPLEAQGWTRASPRFVGGFAGGWLHGYRTVNPAPTRVVHLERIDGSGVKHSYDTTETTGQPTFEKVRGEHNYSAVAALSLPIPIALLGANDNLSFTVGVDISKPTERQYVGLSALQFLGKWIPPIESLPVDFHVLGFFAKQPTLEDPGCAVADCKTHPRAHFQGLAFMISADATQLISDVIKKLNP
jgi:hypothetical protein